MTPGRRFPVSLGRMLEEPSSPLGRLIRHARQLAEWDSRLAASLPEDLRGHVRLADVRGGVAVLLVDSPVWHARTRFRSAAVLEVLRRVPGLEALNATEVRVGVPRPPKPPERRARRPKLSAASAAWLARCAETETDPALRQVLLRLSRR